MIHVYIYTYIYIYQYSQQETTKIGYGVSLFLIQWWPRRNRTTSGLPDQQDVEANIGADRGDIRLAVATVSCWKSAKKHQACIS